MNLALAYDAGRVRRFHTLARFGGGDLQTVAEHSWGVALIALELCKCRGYSDWDLVMEHALVHDLEEYWTGDISAETKHNHPALKRALEPIEAEARHKLGLESLPRLDDEGATIVKWADGLELWAYCYRKIKQGELTYDRVRINIASYLSELPQWKEALDIWTELSA